MVGRLPRWRDATKNGMQPVQCRCLSDVVVVTKRPVACRSQENTYKTFDVQTFMIATTILSAVNHSDLFFIIWLSHDAARSLRSHTVKKRCLKIKKYEISTTRLGIWRMDSHIPAGSGCLLQKTRLNETIN